MPKSTSQELGRKAELEEEAYLGDVKKKTKYGVPKLFVTTEDHIFVVEQSGKEWRVRAKLQELSPECIAADPSRPARLYCGTFGHGLWLTDDFGTTWKQSGKGVINPQVTSVAVSPTEKKEGFGVVY